MQKKLNITKASQAMDKLGLTQSALARSLDVSREAVSQWFSAKCFPKPDKLLQLGKRLSLSFNELVLSEDPFTPRVAFRKMRGTKTQDHHIEKAQGMGRFLRQLVPFLPFDTLSMPPVLKLPDCDYEYLRKVTTKLREDINIGPTDIVDFRHLVRRFKELQAVLVPVFWGDKNRHENAVHIYLPDSKSTWVYLNLDTNIYDFKFWMAHELGHCLSPSLDGKDAEDFADAFAGSLLYPHELAERAYGSINVERTNAAKIARIRELAKAATISPFTIIKQVNNYAKHLEKPEISLDKKAFGGAVTNFNKNHPKCSEALFGKEKLNSKPSAQDYITKATSTFDTPFFSMLGQYLKQHNKGPGFVKTALDMPILDAQAIYTELT